MNALLLLCFVGAYNFVAINGNRECEPCSEEITCTIGGVTYECSRDPTQECSFVWTLNGENFTERCKRINKIVRWTRRKIDKVSKKKESDLKILRSSWRMRNVEEKVDKKLKRWNEHIENKLTKILEQTKQLQAKSSTGRKSVFKNNIADTELRKHQRDLKIGKKGEKNRLNLERNFRDPTYDVFSHVRKNKQGQIKRNSQIEQTLQKDQALSLLPKQKRPLDYPSFNRAAIEPKRAAKFARREQMTSVKDARLKKNDQQRADHARSIVQSHEQPIRNPGNTRAKQEPRRELTRNEQITTVRDARLKKIQQRSGG